MHGNLFGKESYIFPIVNTNILYEFPFREYNNSFKRFKLEFVSVFIVGILFNRKSLFCFILSCEQKCAKLGELTTK